MDDLGFSINSVATANDIVKRVGDVLSSYNIQIKGWCISGVPPPPEMSDQGVCKLAGHLWDVENDTFSINISKITIGVKKKKGSIAHLEIYTWTSLSDLYSFFGGDTKFRTIMSRSASVLDVSGLLSPLQGTLRDCLRRAHIEKGDDFDTNISGYLKKTFLNRLYQVERARNLS